MTFDGQRVTALLRSFAGTGMLVVGDFMLDRTIYGDASRISPEAPTPVILAKEKREQLGGAGNVVRNVDSLGGRIFCAAVVGEDAAGELLGQELRSVRSCREIGIIRESGRKTTLKTRIVAAQGDHKTGGTAAAGYQQVLRIDEETRDPISATTASKILDFASATIGEVGGVIVSDYAKGTLPPFLLDRLIALSRSAKKPVFVDPKGRDWIRYQGASVLTPNAVEAEAALGIMLSEESMASAGWEAEAQRHVNDLGLDALLITRGPEGVSLIEWDGIQHFPTIAREVFDVTGAGDTLIAAFALASASGTSYSEAAQFGNLAAGIAVGKAGAAVVYPFEVEREVNLRHFSAAAKIRKREEIAAIAESLRREGKRIVFTNGCFDLLHVGHVYLLREARKFGDIMIVGMNSDASVKGLKGDGRPIVSAEDRADAVAALECVDYVVVFDEADPMDLIRRIRPDVLVKGDDYKASDVVGADFLNSYGGVVQLVPIRRGVSTSGLIEKIRSATS